MLVFISITLGGTLSYVLCPLTGEFLEVFWVINGVEFCQKYLVSNTLDYTLALPLYIL